MTDNPLELSRKVIWQARGLLESRRRAALAQRKKWEKNSRLPIDERTSKVNYCNNIIVACECGIDKWDALLRIQSHEEYID